MIGIKDIDRKIMSELSDRELLNYCLVNKMNNELCKDETFWRNRTIDKFYLNKKDRDYSWKDFYITLVMYKDNPGKGIDELNKEDNEKNQIIIGYLERLVKQNIYNAYYSEIRYQLVEERPYRGMNSYNEEQIEKFINDHKNVIHTAIDNTYNGFLSLGRLEKLDGDSIYWARQHLNKYIDWSEYFK